MNNLTDRPFWLQYWEKKKDLVFKIPKNYLFLSHLNELISKHTINGFLEIGGFPGYYSVWLSKQYGIESTLLDFVVHEGILNELEVTNDLKQGSVNVIEADLFQYIPEKQFDLIASNGLIEHFNDTRSILAKHTAFLKPGGVLFVTLPNFKGINGWFQRTFDQENYLKHNINSMDIQLLVNTCKSLGLSDIEVRYDGEFMIWLENLESQAWWVPAFMKLVWFPLKVISKLFSIRNRFLSPYIVITATLKN